VNTLARLSARLVLTGLFVSPALAAQGTTADYRRAADLDERFDGLAVDVMDTPAWIGESDRLWYRKSVAGGHEFVVVDAAAATRGPAFDHARLAGGLSRASGSTYEGLSLPFDEITLDEAGGWVQFVVEETRWRCDLASYECEARGPAPEGPGGGGAADPDPFETPWPDDWDQGEDVRQVLALQARGSGRRASEDVEPSPDGRWEAYTKNYNVWLRPVDAVEDEGVALSHDGSEGDFYSLRSIEWSPDSRKLVAYRTRPGYGREVRYVISSPSDQLQPRDSTRFYRKPGDVLDRRQPVLFDVARRTGIVVDDSLFLDPYATSSAEWWEDGRGFTFEYNERGHQVYRVIEVDAETGEARALIEERAGPDSFIHYSGGNFRHDVGDGAEIVWASERDGWRHLYLYDGRTGEVKNRITSGEWVVREVLEVDEETRRIWFSAGGMNEGRDPYLEHVYRIDFDGSDLTAFTEADGQHELVLSPSGDYFVDVWSRVDLAPVGELRRTADRSLVMELENGDLTALEAAGWTRPEVFTAKGRDGETDIWGLIVRPTTFDPSRRYPVIEYIYAGPHDFHTPKSFSVDNAMRGLAELGFIVVQLDGMGTAGRSKAFHDVAWRNLGDAGFPDRIPWHRAVAEEYPWYDISRVGIYGGSAGGQNAMGALLFHPDFYDVAVSFAGCHDNRMDKIWWNEQWMGWPLGPHYAASSNMENAHRLEGELLLIWGELDTNVDPSSSMQVVNALIEADKHFDMLVIPGGDHGAGRRGPTRAYGDLKRNDFFVKHLLGVDPPRRNGVEVDGATNGTR
jgi:dipeptidyl aminopeptidase/acylaminoacyl peptidase